MTVVIVVAAFLLFDVVVGLVLYNRLVSLRNRTDEAWSGVDVQLSRRHDLVPNLVSTVKGYAAHEQQVFTQVTEARAEAQAAEGPAATAPAEQKLTAALGQIRVVAEAYPQLQASHNFLDLQRQLGELEDEIQAARRIYNGNVQAYDTARETVPTMLVRGFGSFEPRPYFETPPAERTAPAVSFTS
jgi:LemA protein